MNARATKYAFRKGMSNPYKKYGRGIARKKKHAKFKGDRAKATFKKRYNSTRFSKWMSKYR